MPTTPTDAQAPRVVVYWRPGCGFCSHLFRKLEAAGVPIVKVDIWEDPEGAAFVRTHARGHETVPTVDVAGQVLVNPSAREVARLATDAGVAVSAN